MEGNYGKKVILSDPQVITATEVNSQILQSGSQIKILPGSFQSCSQFRSWAHFKVIHEYNMILQDAHLATVSILHNSRWLQNSRRFTKSSLSNLTIKMEIETHFLGSYFFGARKYLAGDILHVEPIFTTLQLL